MITFLYVMSAIMGYVIIGGFSAAKHNAIVSAKCRYDNDQHWKGRWCGHACLTVWLAGVFWFVGVPAMASFALGSNTKETRLERRREREISDAKHEAELARVKRIAAEELDRELAVLGK